MASFTEEDPEIYQEEEQEIEIVPSGGEDWETAQTEKDKATEAKANGNYEQAITHYTNAMTSGPVSAMVLANRADCLLKSKRPKAALADCNEALKINPDSAKAIRCRGTVERHLGMWEQSNKDLSAAQAIDFNPDAEEFRQFVASKMKVIDAERAQQRLEDEKVRLAEEEKMREKVKKQREEIAQRRKEEEEEEEREAEERVS